MRRALHIWTVLSLILLAQPALAQSLTAETGTTTVSVGQNFLYKIKLSGTTGSILPPDLSAFDVVQRTSGSESFYSSTSGATSAITLNYVLRAKEKGTLTIGPAKAKTGVGELTSNPITLTAVEGNVAQSPANGQSRAQSNRESNGVEVFLRTYVSKREAVVGEQISVSYVLFANTKNIRVTEGSLPSIESFWVENIEQSETDWSADIETIDGKQYYKKYLARQVLIPQRGGELSIDPLTVTAKYFQGWRSSRPFERTSNKVTIDVKSLPPGGPSFSGAVGRFDLDVSTDRTEVEANGSITLTLTISGEGNLKYFDELDIEWPEGLEVYDPKKEERISVNASGARGKKIYEYLIIPRYAGEYTIDPIEFKYYDTELRQMRSQASDPIQLRIGKGSGLSPDGRSTPAQASRKKEVEVLDNDIRYIDTSIGGLKKKGDYFATSSSHWALLFLPFLSIALLFVIKKRKDKELGDVVGTRRKKAGKLADHHLKKASALLAEGNTSLLHQEIYQAVLDYLSGRFNIPASELDRRTITERMTQDGVAPETQERTERLLTDCEMARYAPSAAKDGGSLLQEAKDLISILEKA